jgi:hypothetical protein
MIGTRHSVEAASRKKNIMPLVGGSNGGSEDGTTHLRFMLGRGQIGRGELGETMEIPLLDN